jgi:hypothetical protein
MKVGSKCPIVWNNPRHASWWWFYLHCVIEETGNPAIISVICHQCRCHPSEHGTSVLRKHLLPNAQITELNDITESDVTQLITLMVDQTALAIQMRKGIWGTTTVSSQRKFIFDIQVIAYWLRWQTKCSTLAAEDLESSEFQQDTWNCYSLVGIVSAHIPWSSISHWELQWSNKVLWHALVLPSPITLGNISYRESAPTTNVFERQLPS